MATRILSAAAAITLLSGCAAIPAGNWRPRDTALEVGWQAVNALDVHSTRQFRDSPLAAEENPVARAFFGAEPRPEDVLVIGLFAGLSHLAITRLLPAKWRPWWQGGTLLMSGAAVKFNCDKGLC